MSKSGIVDLTVQYCGGWGYKRYCDALTMALDDHFQGQVKVRPIRDPNTTGNFEVVLVATGKLLHSKTTRGQGRCTTKEEVDAIIAQLEEYINGTDQTEEGDATEK